MTGNITDTLALPFSRSVNVSSEWQYHTPLYLGGDRLQGGTTTIISVEQKRTRVGTGIFLQYESEYVKVSGELVARNRNTVFNYDPDDASRPEPGTSARAQQATEVPPARAQWTMPIPVSTGTRHFSSTTLRSVRKCADRLWP